MSEASERLLVRIDATTEQLRREMKRADDAVAGSSVKMGKSLDKIGASFAKLGKVAAGLGLVVGAGLGVAFKKIAEASAEQERVTAQLNATLKSTGFAAGKTSEELIATAASLQKVTTYGDEAIIGMQSLLLTFKDIKGDNFDRTTKAVLDMSTAMGQDLKSSALQLGKALNDPIGQLGALSRTGIIFSETQKQMIKDMAKAGDMAGAQILILQELESEFGGSAEAARDTLGGALAGLSNAFGDLFEAQAGSLGPMKDSLSELEEVLSDPQFVAAIHDITAGIIEMAAAVARSIPPTVDFLHFLAMELGLADENAAHLEGSLYEAEQKLARLEKSGRGAGRAANILRNEIAGIRKELDAYYKEQEKANKATEKAAKVTGDAAEETEAYDKPVKAVTQSLKEMQKAVEKAKKEHEKHNKEITKGIAELDEIVRATENYISDLEFQISLVNKTTREQALLTAAREHDARATEEQRARMAQLNAELYDAKAAADVARKAAADTAAAWQESRDVLSGFFFEFARDGKNAFDTLLDGFKAMIAKMIAEAAANQIILGVGAAFGGMGFSGAASAATGAVTSSAAGSFLPSLAGPAVSYFTGNSSLFSPVTAGGGIDASGWAAAEGASPTAGFNWANAGYGFAGGVTGGFASNQVFGSTTGLGNTAGALAGTLIPGVGPFLGPAIGSFLGGGFENLLGNVFGFGGNGGNQAGRADLNLGTGSFNAYGVGKKFDQENVDAATMLAQTLQQFSAVLGGSSAQFGLKVGNRSGIANNGTKYDTAEEFFQAAFDDILKSATNLDKGLRKLIGGFDGSAEQILEFSAAVISMNDMAGINSVTQAIDDFNRVMPTMKEAYQDQSNGLLTLMANFDGSAAAATELAYALATNKQAAYDFAIAIQQIGATLDQATAQSADKIRESALTEQEQRAKTKKERDFVRALLPNLNDPQQIQAALDAIIRLNEELFFSLPEDMRTPDRADDFATYTENSNKVGQRLLDKNLSALEDIQTNLNAGVDAMLTRTAAQFENAGTTLQGAANTFAAVIASLQLQGITVNVTQETAEVNV